MSTRLEAIGISRRFGNVQALQDVALTLEGGRVHCLLGGNGAGKSTLIGVLAGMSAPGTGQLKLDGKALDLNSPRSARQAGIAVVYQELALVPLMSVWRNFVLGAEPVGRLGSLQVDQARAVATAGLAVFELAPDLDRAVATLSGGERQIVAIARAVHYGACILILDEPTAALAVDQATRVLSAVRAARSRGTAILLVTHNPRHALEVGDDITVLERGRIVAARPADTFGLDELHDLISS